MDDGKHGSGDLDDCVASKQFLVDQGYVDPDRIGIIGGSYGGYMVLAALAFRPEAFALGVDLFGVSNWVRTLESIPPWWARVRDFRGISAKAFDGRGNYTLGLKEHVIFPEIDYSKIDQGKGMNVTFVTTATSDRESLSLLRHMGMPFAD